MFSIPRLAHAAWLGAVLVAGVTLLAGCGGGKKASGVDSQVGVAIKEWTLLPDKTSVPAGDVTFTVANAGTVEHEFVVIKTALAPDALKLSGDTVDEEASGGVVDEIAEFQPGTTQKLTLNLAPGNYVLICNVPSHYQHGLRSGFTVTAAAAKGSY